MPNYRRYYVPGGTYFFTCVTFERRPLLATSLARECLRKAIETVQNTYPFEIVAIVLLPDHWHTVWSLPAGDERYPPVGDELKKNSPKPGSVAAAANCVSRYRASDTANAEFGKSATGNT